LVFVSNGAKRISATRCNWITSVADRDMHLQERREATRPPRVTPSLAAAPAPLATGRARGSLTAPRPCPSCGRRSPPLPTGPRAHACPPVCDGGIVRPQAAELEEFQPQNVGNHRAVGVGEAVAREIRTALERIRYPRQQFSVLRQRVVDEFGLEPVLDHAALVLCAPFERRLVDLGQPDLARHL